MENDDPFALGWYLEIVHLEENLISESKHLEGPFLTQADAEYRKEKILTKDENISRNLTINLIML